MQLFYLGKDITESCEVSDATVIDRLGDKCDSAEMCFDNQKEWIAWQPKQGDALEWRIEGYTSGDLYVDEVFPQKSGFFLYAGSMPRKAYEEAWESYEKITLFELMRRAAEVLGMEAVLYGTDGDTVFDWLVRRGEGWMAFLHKIATCEGMWLKSTGKKLLLCNRAWVYAQGPARTYEIDDTFINQQYRVRDTKLGEMKIITPLGVGIATDISVTNGTSCTMGGLSVRSDVQAARWARGLLMAHNEQAETFTLDITLDTGLAAGCTVSLTGLPLTEGLWFAAEVRHDLKNRKTKVEMRRCVTSVI